MKSIKGEAFRFLIAGGTNTVLTYLVYLALLNIVSYRAAFTISFVLGIVFAFVIYSLFVFRTTLVWQKLLSYPILYAVQYFAGLALLSLLVEYVGVDNRIAPLINVVVLTPLTFILNKWFISKRGML